MEVYGISNDSLTEEVRKYLDMMREDYQYIDITSQKKLSQELAERTSGDLQLVWIKINGTYKLIQSLSELCALLQCEGITENK